MIKYLLPSGRTVTLYGWRVVGTYAGVMEGSKKTASKYIREELPERAERLLPSCRPLAIINASAKELPSWLCVAKFESSDGVNTTNIDFCSRLSICWFTEDIGENLDDIIKPILPQIDWDKFAENYDPYDF